MCMRAHASWSWSMADEDPKVCILKILDTIDASQFQLASAGPSTSRSQFCLSQHFRVCDDQFCSKILETLFPKIQSNARNPNYVPPTICLCQPCNHQFSNDSVWREAVLQKLKKVESQIGSGTEVNMRHIVIFIFYILLSAGTESSGIAHRDIRYRCSFCILDHYASDSFPQSQWRGAYT